MIISHKHKFIFVKTHKTAGTSIEVDLLPHLGPNDVVTPLYPSDPNHKPQNFLQGNFAWYNHMPAKTILSFLGDKFYEYTTFCVEREPVDKTLSAYNWYCYNQGGTQPLTIDQFINTNELLPIDHKLYTHNNKLIIDKIIKYESLNELNDLFSFDFKLKTRAKGVFKFAGSMVDKQKEIVYNKFLESNKFTGYSL